MRPRRAVNGRCRRCLFRELQPSSWESPLARRSARESPLSSKRGTIGFSAGQFPAERHRPIRRVGQDDAQQPQDRFVAIQIVIVDRGVVAGGGQRVLGEVVRADAEEVDVLRAAREWPVRRPGSRPSRRTAGGSSTFRSALSASNVSRIRRISSSSVTIGISTRTGCSCDSLRIAPICVRTSCE